MSTFYFLKQGENFQIVRTNQNDEKMYKNHIEKLNDELKSIKQKLKYSFNEKSRLQEENTELV